MWLLVGLGNPGAKYETTRHNLGFLVVDALIDYLSAEKASKNIFDAVVAKSSFNEQQVLLMKPQTFMNHSGKAVQQAMAFHKIDLNHVLIIHDDLDLDLGEMKLKQGGSNGGHNGIKDIARLVGPDFLRLRLGIGRPKVKGNEANFVLDNFSNQEILLINDLLPKAIKAINILINNNLEHAQAHCQIKRQKPSLRPCQ